MNVQAYIESGIIHDYCLGLLGPADMQETERHAAAYPEIRAELEACRQALEQYVRSLAIPVPGPVKNKALGFIDNLSKEG
jgi:anti-sigma factor RsiW